MPPRTRLSLTLVLAALAPAALSAQSEGRAPRVLELPASTRAMALGGAYMMDSGHADALFHHPALVADATGFGLDVQTWSGEATAAAVSGAMAWLGGGVAVGLQTLQYGAATGTTGILPGGQDVLFDEGAAITSERVASVGYARRLFGLRVGVGGKLIEQRVGGARDATAAVDVGVSTDLGPLRLGLSAANLGEDLEVGGTQAPLPTRVTFGAGAYGRPVGPLDLGLAAEVERRDDGEVTAGLGVELGYWPVNGRTFVGRVGLQRVPEGEGSPLTLGFAFWGDDIVLEWAWRDFGDLGDSTHRFGVRWR